MANKTREARYIPALAILLLITLGATGWLLLQMGNQPTAAGSNAAVDVLSSGHAANNQARRAIAGDQNAFKQLAATAEALNAIQTTSLNAAQKTELGSMRAAAAVVLKSQEDVLAMHTAVNQLYELSLKFSARIYDLQGKLNMQRQPAAMAHLERLRLLGESLPELGQRLYTGAPAIDQRMLANEMEMQQIVGALQEGDPALGLTPLAGEEITSYIAGLARRADQLSDSMRLALQMASRLPPVLEASAQLDAATTNYNPGRLASLAAIGGSEAEMQRLFALLGGAGFIVVLMLILWLMATGKGSKAEQISDQSQGDQQAILQLLDELSSLADGDLTVQATVGEDVTGAIADSINYAIEAMRDLVATINEGAILVENTTKQTEASAKSLEAASEAQARQVKDATEAVHNMAASIDEVSGNAERSSDVARHSVDIAHKGGDAVRRTIEGMNTIRETIQDTSKRIKRLGESSQEIGDIVELINDIADQTNVLALNASIQASMAGEAGRGFAVVADEVQRLAERSANATKQIEVLVSTIQSDTNEAVVSMERSTTDVVGGALLAENAGAALEEIEQVSNQIAMLVQNISGSAREQTEAAKTVLHIVERLNQISAETDASASTTTRFISKLSPLASQLRESVAGFVLPGDAGIAKASDEQERADADGAELPEKIFADEDTA